MSNLSPSTINNGSQSFRVYEMEGLVYPAKPITQLLPIHIHNLVANVPKRFNLANFINQDLSVHSLRVDFQLDDDGSESNRPYGVNITFKTLEQDRVIDYLIWNTNQASIDRLEGYFLIHNKDLEIKSAIDLNRLTLYCEPVHLLPSVNIVIVDNSNNQT